MPEHPRLYLGLDTGATKTHAIIADEHGHVLGAGQSGPGNWEGVGLEGAYRVYLQAVEQASRSAGVRIGQLGAAGYGLAGLDFPSDEARLGQVVQRLGVPGPQVLVNDTFVALRAGSRRGWGIVIISGTGANVAGCNRDGQRFRTFGEGQALGDLGGASDIVWLAIRAVAQAYTGRGRPTQLTERFLAWSGASDALAFLEGICRGTVAPPSAAQAPMVVEAARAGDSVAQEILRDVGRDQGANAAAVARRLGMLEEPFDLVLAGGVFRSGYAPLVDAIVEVMHEQGAKPIPLVLDTAPVVGGVLLAMEADGVKVSPSLHDRLAGEAAEALAALAGNNMTAGEG